MRKFVNWDNFIDKLKEGKKIGKTKGLSVPAITNLLFAGAFDDLIGGDDSNGYASKYQMYNRMFEDVKKALKSKASLPNKKKGEAIGLADVQSDLHLALWRQQVNPLSSFDLIGAYLPQLKLRGYERDSRPGTVAYKKKNSDDTVNFLLPDWGYIFKYEGTPQWNAVTSKQGMGRIVYLGIVSEVNTLRWANGTKEMIKFKIYIGKETTDEIVCWPEHDTGKIREYTKESLKPGLIALFRVKPTTYQGRRGANLIDFDVIGGRTSV